MRIGRYTLTGKLATGGMAELFLAQPTGPTEDRKTLVVKMLLPHLAEDKQFNDMFLSEAKLATQLNHPNLIQTFDWGEAAGTRFIAMEYVDGPNLRMLSRQAAVREISIPLALCARIVSLACAGLGYAHRLHDSKTGLPLNIIHRDISLDNILISLAGSVKVLDFGIAKATTQVHRSEIDVLKGRLKYMPPEQLRGEPLDHRADIYALGVVLYELITGQHPFDADNEATLLRWILYEPFVEARRRRPDVPEELAAIVRRALAKKRDERYPSCHAMQQDLDGFLLHSGQSVDASHLADLVRLLSEPAPERESRVKPAPAARDEGATPRLRPRPGAVVLAVG